MMAIVRCVDAIYSSSFFSSASACRWFSLYFLRYTLPVWDIFVVYLYSFFICVYCGDLEDTGTEYFRLFSLVGRFQNWVCHVRL